MYINNSKVFLSIFIPSIVLIIGCSPKEDPTPEQLRRSFLKAEDYIETIANCNLVIEKNEYNALAFINRGIAKFNLNRKKEALQDLNKGIDYLPYDSNKSLKYKSYFNRCVVKNKLGDFYTAISDCNIAIQFKPEIARTYFERGISKQNLGEAYEALKDFSKAITIDPSNAKLYRARASAKNILGDKKGSCKDWKKASTLGDKGSKDIYDDRCVIANPYKPKPEPLWKDKLSR